MRARVALLAIGLVAATGPASADDHPRAAIAERLAADPDARDLATALYDLTGTVVTTVSPRTIDGGFRGRIRLVPALPIRADRKHLSWSLGAFRDIEATFDGLQVPAAPATYRFRDLELAFFRSVGRTTPSAYAIDWTVAYNVAGSLFKDEASVRETLVHEIFHLNDFAHGDWSRRVLAADVAAILKRCGQRTACLEPYAPGKTMVRGGTWYAFQRGNGETVREYAAELAVRWYEEQRAALRGERFPGKAFKCGPPENARAWTAMVGEFFGVDRVPACA
jgi:hypothetical protein